MRAIAFQPNSVWKPISRFRLIAFAIKHTLSLSNPVSETMCARTGVTCDDDSATSQHRRLIRPFHSNLSRCAAKVTQAFL